MRHRKLPPPTSQRMEVLKLLIERPALDRKSAIMNDIYNLPDAIRQVRRLGVVIHSNKKEKLSKYKNKISLTSYKLDSKKEGIKIYFQLADQSGLKLISNE